MPWGIHDPPGPRQVISANKLEAQFPLAKEPFHWPRDTQEILILLRLADRTLSVNTNIL